MDDVVDFGLRCEMADEDIIKLLEAWGLGEYIQVFTDNKITADTLVLLDDELCKELIKPIGDRAKFLKNLAELKKISTNEPTQMEFSFLDVDVLNDSHRLSNIGDIINCESPSVLYDATTTDNRNQDEPQTKPLKELLQKTNEGRGILNLYEEEGKLSSNGRRKLCNIIITNLLEKNPEQRISSETLLSKAQEIKDVFGKENIYTYFIPYINNTKLKIKRCAKGKLYDCLQNKRRQYREAKVIDQKQTTIAINEPGTSGTTSSVLIPTDDLLWLQNSCDPWHTVEQKWKDTSKYRLDEIKDGSSISIDDYMNKYPALKTAGGSQLLVEDFKTLYAGFEDKLFENFFLYKNKILDLAFKKLNNTQDPTIKQIINECQQLLLGEETSSKQEATSIAAFMLLPLALGNPLAKNKKCSWRPSKQESRDGFITHVKRAMDVQDTLNRRKQKYARLGVTFQPTIVLVGETYSEIEKYYVVVNDTYYTVTSILQAVDVCFKIYHSLHSQYPVESVSIWTFIQKGLYKIHTPWDKCYSTVSAIFTDLGIE